MHGEISNIEWVCKTIDSALLKASKLAPVTIKQAIFNVPTWDVIWEINKINYVRKEPQTDIDEEEFDTIISKVEHFSIKKAQNKIYEDFWYKNFDTKLITSSIIQTIIDNKLLKIPIWKSWKEVNISVLNIFLPVSKYNIIKSIGKYISKEINYVIPKEFALSKLISMSSFAEENVTILDVWYFKTRIIIQKWGKLIWLKIINLWIIDLINLIKKIPKKQK